MLLEDVSRPYLTSVINNKDIFITHLTKIKCVWYCNWLHFYPNKKYKKTSKWQFKINLVLKLVKKYENKNVSSFYNHWSSPFLKNTQGKIKRTSTSVSNLRKMMGQFNEYPRLIQNSIDKKNFDVNVESSFVSLLYK